MQLTIQLFYTIFLIGIHQLIRAEDGVKASSLAPTQQEISHEAQIKPILKVEEINLQSEEQKIPAAKEEKAVIIKQDELKSFWQQEEHQGIAEDRNQMGIANNNKELSLLELPARTSPTPSREGNLKLLLNTNSEDTTLIAKKSEDLDKHKHKSSKIEKKPKRNKKHKKSKKHSSKKEQEKDLTTKSGARASVGAEKYVSQSKSKKNSHKKHKNKEQRSARKHKKQNDEDKETETEKVVIKEEDQDGSFSDLPGSIVWNVPGREQTGKRIGSSFIEEEQNRETDIEEEAVDRPNRRANSRQFRLVKRNNTVDDDEEEQDTRRLGPAQRVQMKHKSMASKSQRASINQGRSIARHASKGSNEYDDDKGGIRGGEVWTRVNQRQLNDYADDSFGNVDEENILDEPNFYKRNRAPSRNHRRYVENASEEEDGNFYTSDRSTSNRRGFSRGGVDLWNEHMNQSGYSRIVSPTYAVREPQPSWNKYNSPPIEHINLDQIYAGDKHAIIGRQLQAEEFYEPVLFPSPPQAYVTPFSPRPLPSTLNPYYTPKIYSIPAPPVAYVPIQHQQLPVDFNAPYNLPPSSTVQQEEIKGGITGGDVWDTVHQLQKQQQKDQQITAMGGHGTIDDYDDEALDGSFSDLRNKRHNSNKKQKSRKHKWEHYDKTRGQSQQNQKKTELTGAALEVYKRQFPTLVTNNKPEPKLETIEEQSEYDSIESGDILVSFDEEDLIGKAEIGDDEDLEDDELYHTPTHHSQKPNSRHSSPSSLTRTREQFKLIAKLEAAKQAKKLAHQAKQTREREKIALEETRRQAKEAAKQAAQEALKQVREEQEALAKRERTLAKRERAMNKAREEQKRADEEQNQQLLQEAMEIQLEEVRRALLDVEEETSLPKRDKLSLKDKHHRNRKHHKKESEPIKETPAISVSDAPVEQPPKKHHKDKNSRKHSARKGTKRPEEPKEHHVAVPEEFQTPGFDDAFTSIRNYFPEQQQQKQHEHDLDAALQEIYRQLAQPEVYQQESVQDETPVDKHPQLDDSGKKHRRHKHSKKEQSLIEHAPVAAQGSTEQVFEYINPTIEHDLVPAEPPKQEETSSEPVKKESHHVRRHSNHKKQRKHPHKQRPHNLRKPSVAQGYEEEQLLDDDSSVLVIYMPHEEHREVWNRPQSHKKYKSRRKLPQRRHHHKKHDKAIAEVQDAHLNEELTSADWYYLPEQNEFNDNDSIQTVLTKSRSISKNKSQKQNGNKESKSSRKRKHGQKKQDKHGKSKKTLVKRHEKGHVKKHEIVKNPEQIKNIAKNFIFDNLKLMASTRKLKGLCLDKEDELLPEDELDDFTFSA